MEVGSSAAVVCAKGAPSPRLSAARLDFAVACWCSRPFRKNSFIAPSRRFKYVKQLFVLGLELDIELMREREKCCPLSE